MKISQGKIIFFEEVLLDFFRKSGRVELPWRKKNITAYEVWVSEIMLQQTQVSRVIDYYTKFLRRFPNGEVLAKASWEDFLPYYQGLGYYARGRNMLLCAKMVQEKYKGVFPKEKKLLESLPGIGPYTAAAILSFAYNDKHLAWDTNLKRVVGRFFFGSKKADIDEQYFEKYFSLPRKKLNAALMDFGSALCSARPKCANCPLQKKCVYYQEGGKQEKTLQKNKKNFPTKDACVEVYLHERHKKYFAQSKKKYSPFILPAAYNTRAGIKTWFRENFNLEVSVRPPHQEFLKQGKPFLRVNAQILQGSHSFREFSKKEVAAYTKEK